MNKLIFLLCYMLLSKTPGFAQNKELPALKAANAAAFFIPASVCKKFKLEPAKGDAWMKVYNNLEDGAKLQRVNDIRWQASSKDEALTWYAANSDLLGEKGKDVTDQVTRPVGVDAWNVYEPGEEMQRMMEGMGVKQNQYTYTFVVDKYVAKIFVGVNDATSLKESWSFVKEGLKALLKASGKPKLAALIL
jgi:hypothetical protein